MNHRNCLGKDNFFKMQKIWPLKSSAKLFPSTLQRQARSAHCQDSNSRLYKKSRTLGALCLKLAEPSLDTESPCGCVSALLPLDHSKLLKSGHRSCAGRKSIKVTSGTHLRSDQTGQMAGIINFYKVGPYQL